MKPIRKNNILKESREITTATNRLIKTLYREVDDLTSHIYRDNDWRYVNNLLQKIEDAIGSDGDLSVWCENGGYIKDREGTPVRKEWHLKIELNNGGLIGGIVNAHAAGSTYDPFDAYDITCTFWREQLDEQVSHNNESWNNLPDYEESNINIEDVKKDIDYILKDASREVLGFFAHNHEKLAYAAGYDCFTLNRKDYIIVLKAVNDVLQKYHDVLYT